MPKKVRSKKIRKDIRHEISVSGQFVFTAGPLKLVLTPRFRGRRRLWKLSESYDITIRTAGVKETISIPAGYETDLASIPLICQVVLGGRDDYAEESIVHDWLCDLRSPRFYTNAKMRSIMEALDRPKWKVLAVYYALMAFGYGSPIFKLAGAVKRYVERGIRWLSTKKST